MATETKAIEGEGINIDGTYSGGVGTYADLNDDSDTSTLTLDGSTNNQDHDFNFEDFTLPHDGTISVTLYFRARTGPTGAAAWPYTLIGGTKYETVQAITTSFTDYSKVWTTNPAGGDWTSAILNGATFGITAKGNDYVFWAKTWLVITYTPFTLVGAFPTHLRIV